MDLQINTTARRQWEAAVPIVRKALNRGWLKGDDDNGRFNEKRFADEMLDEWEMNGVLFEPTKRQFDCFLQLARDHE